jgi:prophage DNA circulation protein
MTNIFDLPAVWRQSLMPASYNGARFHCETNSRDSGRRIVEHQFPKKELPYAEDMGRAAREFSIRGYCIVYPYDSEYALYSRDYRIARDALVKQLESEGPGVLQLPTQPSQRVVCPRYRLSEEERFGGYCVIDMTFQEYGLDPQEVPNVATAQVLVKASESLRSQVVRVLSQQPLPPPTGLGAIDV